MTPTEAVENAPAHVVFYSGGVASWAAAKRLCEPMSAEERADVVLLFTDTLIEDPDLYRFLEEGAANIGANLVRIAEGRTPWEVFRDVRFLGNTRADPCSRVLKREPAKKWVDENCNPDVTTLHFGISWEEAHRWPSIERNWLPFKTSAPLMDAPYLFKNQVMDLVTAEGIAIPDLYSKGFPHNNCGGFCVKAGQAHFLNLLRHYPERYADHEAEEVSLRRYLDSDVAILRDRTKGETRPLTLFELRARAEQDDQTLDLFEWGGCGCFVDNDEAAA
jgi:hypothetical protein